MWPWVSVNATATLMLRPQVIRISPQASRLSNSARTLGDSSMLPLSSLRPSPLAGSGTAGDRYSLASIAVTASEVILAPGLRPRRLFVLRKVVWWGRGSTDWSTLAAAMREPDSVPEVSEGFPLGRSQTRVYRTNVYCLAT